MSTLTGTQIKNTYQSLLKFNDNGSLNPTSAVSVSDGLGNKTPLLLSGIEFKTQVVSASKSYGFWADLSSNSHVAIGDYNSQYNGTQLYLSDTNRLIQTYGSNQVKGIKLDFANLNYYFGDFNKANTGTCLNIEDAYASITTKYNGALTGLQLDFYSKAYKLGDYFGNNNGTTFQVDDQNRTMSSKFSGSEVGLFLNGTGKVSALGDYNSTSTGTSIAVDYLNEDITLKANTSITLTGSGLTSATAGSTASLHLRVNINGVFYKIQLKNDV